MAIIINIDVMLAKRKMSVTELADKVGIYDGQYLGVEEWQSEGNSAINIGRDL
jgi:hypothetical protein